MLLISVDFIVNILIQNRFSVFILIYFLLQGKTKMRRVGMEKCRNEVGAEGGCKHKGCAKPAVTWRVRRGRITLKGGIATNTRNKHEKNIIDLFKNIQSDFSDHIRKACRVYKVHTIFKSDVLRSIYV